MSQTPPTPDLKKLRHKMEIPLLRLGYLATLLTTIIAIILLFSGIPLREWILGVLVVLFAPITAFIMARYLYFSNVANGIEVTKRQFPELHTTYQEIASKMGFTRESPAPPLYIKNGNGLLSAFTGKCSLSKTYIVIHSDIIAIAYHNNDWRIVRYTIAHELGHIKCQHSQFRRLLAQPVLKFFLLDKALHRAQEYSADRVACYYDSKDALSAIYLYAGKQLGSYVNISEYFNTIAKHDDDFSLKIANAMSNYPVGYRRMQILRQMQSQGYDVHGKLL
ncbi:M48 family metalloprotease [Streptococcus sp. CSL10205-OR2]|uniref:M48 family metalloprotease n=1 Tax=Streptococcus sp. CSL10205-OR2 TaxID=2980558 RepID=UPI0021D8F5F3|nr:M48 family metalloprotease [Streptococcus sp. CSL10205-OR2]MCU9534098.1 M48 family metalloprotease [Streptococcus sp. CSL10205-OR2]